jgi:hypothetical protein
MHSSVSYVSGWHFETAQPCCIAKTSLLTSLQIFASEALSGTARSGSYWQVLADQLGASFRLFVSPLLNNYRTTGRTPSTVEHFLS